MGKVNNIGCVSAIATVASTILSLFVSVLYKGQVEYCSKGKIMGRLAFILSIILLWTVTVMVYETNQLNLNNRFPIYKCV